jgi:hypothetical protein
MKIVLLTRLRTSTSRAVPDRHQGSGARTPRLVAVIVASCSVSWAPAPERGRTYFAGRAYLCFFRERQKPQTCWASQSPTRPCHVNSEIFKGMICTRISHATLPPAVYFHALSRMPL